MTNIMETSNVKKEVQAMSESKSKSPKGDFAAVFKVETETLKMDMTEEEEPVRKSIVIETEKEVEKPHQEEAAIGEEVDKSDDAISLLSCLIQVSPPRQIKNSVPSLKPGGDAEAVGTRLTPAGNREFQEPLAVEALQGLQETQELAIREEISAFKVETSAPAELQQSLPQEIKEIVKNHTPAKLAETKLNDMLPKKQNKRDISIVSQNKIELEPKKIEENTFGSKIVSKIAEFLEKSDPSFPSGEAKEKDPSSNMQKKSQVDTLENLSSTIKANGIQKPQLPSPPVGATVEKENLEVVTKEILHRMETLTEGNKTMIRVKLHPEEMGEMEVSLSMEEGRLTGKIIVGNKEIQQIFTEKLNELSQTLKDNRIDVASFEVKISPDLNQNQDHSRHQGRRAVEYFNKFNGHRNGSTQTEEWLRPENTTNRGIDLLA